ncbi:MAG TPA: Rho termination factor N-terminal domain-containing protein, partial [Mycobacteriales bacterium]|nr:Rho termination factor N-terminal domain-containing protein [Mycobacteriales bacterium]
MSETRNDGPAPAATDGADAGAAAANGNGAAPRRRSSSGLAGKLLPELQQLAGDLGITGIGKMRKSELIAAIQERQPGNGVARSGGERTASGSRRQADHQADRQQRDDADRQQREDAEQTDARRSGADESDGQR